MWVKDNTKRGRLGLLGRLILALMGLFWGLLFFGLFTLTKVHYTRILPVKSQTDPLLQGYLDYDSHQEALRSKVPLAVNPDYPIAYVKQKDKAVKNILVFGVDSRGEVFSRADTIVILTIDNRTKSIKLTSVLRDTQMRMNSTAGNPDKVNAAYAYGGVGMLINTLNTNLDLDIQQFVMFDFWSAVDFVDAVGGVRINVDENELSEINAVIKGSAETINRASENKPLKSGGVQTLNGIQALGWSRIRKIDSDFGRTSRQRVLMEMIVSKFKSYGLFGKIAFASNVAGEFVTNIDTWGLMSNAVRGLAALSALKQYYVPYQGYYYVDDSSWNLVMDENKQISELHRFIWGN